MSTIRLLPHCRSSSRSLGAAAVLAGALLFTGACGNYQLALQGTATPAAGGALGVRQLPPVSPQPVTVDPAALIAAQAGPANGATAPAGGASAQAGAPLPASASPALAVAAPARPAIGDQPGGTTAAAANLPATATPAARATAAAPRTATPMPSFTATAPRAAAPAPRATATTAPASPSPSPSPSPAQPTTAQVYLPEGVSDFMYAGRTLPVDQALAALAGAYDVVYFKPAGATEQIAYRPGIDAVPTLPNNTLVRIGMRKAMSFVMTLP